MKEKVYRPIPDEKYDLEDGFIFNVVDEYKKVLLDYCIQEDLTL